MSSVFAAGVSEVPSSGLRDAVRTASFRRLRTSADLRAVADLLDRAGLRWLVFKGPVLDEVVYRRPGLRDYVDVDVLVHPDDAEAALDLILAAGAQLIDRNWALVRAKRQSELSVLLRHGSVLDFHWHVVSSPAIRAALTIDVDAMFDAVERVRIGDRLLPTLSRLDTVWYVALHGVLSGGHRMSWLADLDQALRWAAPDARALRDRARRHGALLALQVQLDRLTTSLAPDLLSWRSDIGRCGPWRALCRIVTGRVALDPGPDANSGRLVVSATRRDTRTSLVALRHAIAAYRQSGPDRRTAVIDMTALHEPGGTDADRAAWFAAARAETRSPPVRR